MDVRPQTLREPTSALRQKVARYLLLVLLLAVGTSPVVAATLNLSDEEKAWLAQHPEIRLGIDPDWAPFEYRDEQGVYSGMASDYIRLLSERLGVKLVAKSGLSWSEVIEQAQQRQLDILPAVMKSPQRAEYLNFTAPYLDFPMVIITRSGDSFVASLDDLVGRRVAVVRGYVTQDILENNHPELSLELVANNGEGLQAVALGEVDAYVGNLAAISYAIERRGLTNLRVAAPTPYSFPLGMGVRNDWPELITILDKAIASIEPEIARSIRGHWMSVEVKQGIDPVALTKTLAPIVIAVALVLIVVIRTNRRLRSEVNERMRVAEELRLNEERLNLAMSVTNDGLFDWDMAKNEVYYSPRYYTMAGYLPNEFPGTFEEWSKRVHKEDFPVVEQALQTYLAGEREEVDVLFRFLRKDGGWMWIRGRSKVVERSDSGQPLRLVGTHTDYTLQKSAEQKLQLAASVFNHAREGIVITDTEGTIVEVNDAFVEITGYEREEVLGNNPSMLKSGRQGPEFYATMWHDLIEKGYWSGEVWNRRKSGEVYAEMLTISAVYNSKGEMQNYAAIFTDITSQKKHQQQLEHIAHYDVLTGLPNRVLLADRMQQSLARAKRQGQQLVVAFIDLDGFKEVNDLHGHDAGDQLLINLARRMWTVLREEDTIARLGGDEFVAVLTDLNDIQESIPLLKRLLTTIAQPVQSGQLELRVTGSIGVSFYPQADEMDSEQLLRQADQAMYQAKLAGKNHFHIFDTEHDRNVRGYHASLERIRTAVAEQEFVLYYQPKVNMRSGEVIGVEALIRWQHPERGLVPPMVFLPVVEDHPLGVELGEWVIDTALSQLNLWQQAGLQLSLSINISANHIQQENFTERLYALLTAYPDLDTRMLELEVLETSALEDIDHISHVMQELSRMGIHFSLDDFGTGYSSLTYLKRLPAALLKIDQSFVRDMLVDPDDLAIVESVLGLAETFNRQVIAEGVETVEHGELLLLLGCELAQGYGIAKPMPADEVEGWAAEWQTEPRWKGLSARSRDDLPLLFAGVEHRAWIKHAEQYLRGERHDVPQVEHTKCRFGKWLHSEGEARYGSEAAYHAIIQLHHQVHELVVELLALHSSGRSAEAVERLDELNLLRDTLFGKLLQLMQESPC